MASPNENKVSKLGAVSRFESRLSYCYLFVLILLSILIVPSLFGGLSTYTFMYEYTGAVLRTPSRQPMTSQPPLVSSVTVTNITLDDPVVINVASNGSSSSNSSGSGDGDGDGEVDKRRSRDEYDDDECDMFKGEWVPNPGGRHYSTNCSMILEHNCVNYGRPDLGYLNWKWRPTGFGCGGDLPEFDPWEFFAAVKGKSIAFVGDSIARNQMQSLICLLSEAELPEYASNENDTVPCWRFISHNFTIAMFWSPFLVRTSQQSNLPPKSKQSHSNRLNMYLDEPDKTWTENIHSFDYLIISVGHWFNHPLYYHKRGLPIGCTYSCDDSLRDGKNLTDVYSIPYGYRASFRTSFKAILDNKYNGTVFLRTFSPGHFQGVWNDGADCPQTNPRRSGEVKLEGEEKEFYMAQVEEFNLAKERARGMMTRFRVLDVTQAMLLRPDGHPNRYRRDPLQADCVHWCLPGPVDYWNTFLLQMIKRSQQ